MVTRTFIKTDKQLNRSTYLRRKSDGAEIKLSPLSKQLYNWFFDKHYFFCVQQNGEFYNNQNEIAEENGCSTNSIKSFVKEFEAFGVLKKTVKKLQGFIESNSYIVVDIFNSGMYEFLDAKKKPTKLEVVEEKESVENKPKPSTYTPPKKKPYTPPVDDLDEPPF